MLLSVGPHSLLAAITQPCCDLDTKFFILLFSYFRCGYDFQAGDLAAHGC